jgi:hypothetical protein
MFWRLIILVPAMATVPWEGWLRPVVGLALIALIARQIWAQLDAPPEEPDRRPTHCQPSGHPLVPEEPVHVDRRLPTWAICGPCHDRLTPAERRLYRPQAPTTPA